MHWRVKLADFWNSLLTEKSWNVLQKIAKESFSFVLIGGWAAYLWTNLHKSKDIDIALTNVKDLEQIKQKYDLKKNDRLKKYEIRIDDIDVYIYVPYYSKLAIPVEDMKDYAGQREGLAIVKPEALLILKQGAELEREESVKGTKDQIDIMTLLCFADFDLSLYNQLLKKYKLEQYLLRLINIIKNFSDYDNLNLTPRQFSLKKKEILNRLRSV